MARALFSAVIYAFLIMSSTSVFFFFFFNDTATTEIYTLSLHDALPISILAVGNAVTVGIGRDELVGADVGDGVAVAVADREDRKSTRLNSSHSQISYAVFCLKKKKKKKSC